MEENQTPTPIIATGDNVNGQPVIIAEAVKSFEQIKEDILKRAIEKDACIGGKRDARNAETIEALLLVIKANMRWLLNSKTIDAAWMEENFSFELLWENYIYTSGVHNISLSEANVAAILTLGSSSATVETLGSSSATVETWGSSSATVKTLGSSSATVKTLGSSSATVETWGSSSATVETWGSSSATVKTLGSSSANIANYHSSKLEHSLGDGACPLIKHLIEKKVYIKTTEFTIEQIN